MSRVIVVSLLMVLQLVAGGVLLFDILSSVLGLNIAPIAWGLYELVEIAAVLGLILGMVVSIMIVSRSLRAQQQAEESLKLASGAFMAVLEDRFDTWGLTPAERDVGLFAIKGLSTAEIARLRDTSEGTVKAQTNAIYRKAGVKSRAQLLSLFIDDLLEGPLT